MPAGIITRWVQSCLGRDVLFSGGSAVGGGFIPYAELIDGSKVTITPDTVSASKVVDVAWGRHREFEVTMTGASYYTGTGSRLSRFLPQAYSNDYANLYCTGADMLMGYGNARTAFTQLVPIDSGSIYNGNTANASYIGYSVNRQLSQIDPGDIFFNTARYQLTFTRLNYSLLLDANITGSAGELNRFVEREAQHSADNIPVPSGSFRWVTAPQHAIQEGGVPKVFAVRQLTYVWRDIPEDVMPTVRSRIEVCIGRVNGLVFDNVSLLNGGARKYGYPIGTVLFIGAEEIPTQRDNGIPIVARLNLPNYNTRGRMYNVKFNFLYRNNGLVSGVGASGTYAGWNYLFRGPSFSPQFQIATSDGTLLTGARIYGSADLNMLFDVNALAVVPLIG